MPTRCLFTRDRPEMNSFLFFFWFSAGSWLVLLGVATVKTGREMFTSVPSQGPETAVTNSISKVKLDFLSFDLCPLHHPAY